MAFHEGNDSGGGRRSSTERPHSSSNDSQSEESYDLEEFAVADGFRPSAFSNDHPPPQSIPQSHLQPPNPPLLQRRASQSSSSSASHHFLALPQAQAIALDSSAGNGTIESHPGLSIPRPSSVSKPHRPHDSLSLRNDGSNLASTTQSSLAHVTPISSSATLLRNDSGHPSTTGVSNTGPDQGNGPRGPAHPYSLYPQNTVTVEDGNSPHIPVGFPGLGNSYQRQIGPDGEEAGDMIGPLGHTEELPPYTRYPDPVYTRGNSQNTATATTTTTSSTEPENSASTNPDEASHTPSTTNNSETARAPPPVGAGATVIANATAPAAPAVTSPTQTTDLASLEENSPGQSRRSLRSDNISDNSHAGLNSATRAITEKLPMGKWQRRARKRLWGVIPYWSICLVLTGVVILAIIMGAVIGTVLVDDHSPKGTQADVQPISALPPDLTPLATGLFDLPPLDVTQSPRICFQDTTQSQAWSCEMPFRYYSMHVGPVPNVSDVENYELTMRAINGSDAIYVWGTQPPVIQKPLQLQLVSDSFEPSRGPAWWQKFTYDKVVVVAESNMAATKQQKRKDFSYHGNANFDPSRFSARPGGPQEGDKPWICTWPDTHGEIFIYPNQNASNPTPSSSSSDTSNHSSTTSDSEEPSQTPSDPTPAYPQVVKLLERRIIDPKDNSSAATCRQVEIINGGRDKKDVLDSDGFPVEVFINERQSSWQEQLAARERSRHPQSSKRELVRTYRLDRRESLELTDCGCLWWST